MNSKKSFTLLFLLTVVGLSNSFSQTVLNDKLIKFPNLEVRHVDNPFYREYFEVYIDQPINHDDPKSETFKQRFCVGYNGLDVPNIMDLDGYGIDYAARKGYVDELSKALKCNLVTVEHRYFGKSVPKKIDWRYLTTKQAADDIHAIKMILETVMKGKWLVTGSNKGGQTALAYRMYYPKETDAAMVYGTPVRKDANDKRLIEYFANEAKTECGKTVLEYQKVLLQNKKLFLPYFEKYAAEKNISYKNKGIETIYEYSVLYYQVCFYQMCNACIDIPTDTASYRAYLKSLVDVVPPRFFSDDNKQRYEASFYMFYNELGNYEYDIKPFEGLLKSNSYSNAIFCPENVTMKFDKKYITGLNTYLSKEASKTIFIYGENDPLKCLQPEVKAKDENYKYIVKNACHKVKIADMAIDQRKEIYKNLALWVGCKFPEEK